MALHDDPEKHGGMTLTLLTASLSKVWQEKVEESQLTRLLEWRVLQEALIMNSAVLYFTSREGTLTLAKRWDNT
jgi:hypothetical protein